ncbi:MAG: helix-turn-helix domain-containing protein [Solirubrobacterales bacterium]|nr:helix-turn-helix domain-containing protein [Solirubrobacterales bacterium]
MELGAPVADALRPASARLTSDVLATVSAAVPPFQEWLDGTRTLAQGIEQGLRDFLERLSSSDGAPLRGRDVYFDFGRGELRAGRPLDHVLTAYRVAAQAAWRGIAEIAEAAGLPPRTVYVLASAVFAHIDDMAAATIEGYTYEGEVRLEERQDTRRRLVEALLRRSAGPDVARLAEEAGWRLPAWVAVLAFGGERAARVAARLPADALVARVDGVGYGVVPDPGAPGRREALRASFAEVRAALGPTVELRDAAESARLARLARALEPDAGGLVLVDEHRVDLLLLQDPVLAGGLAGEVLGPLDGLAEPARERLLATLAAWLEHQGEVRPVADALHVHVQTVRYRVTQLRALLGPRLGTAEGRLQLELALRARRLSP